jgi:hypothetical protein
MSSELVIRAGRHDHVVVADLLAPGGGALMPRQRPLISRLVSDATAPKLADYAEAAAGAGIPFLIDPLTPLLQGELRDEDPWARLPFGVATEVTTADLSAGYADRYVEEVVRFQLDRGATTIIPPYAYSESVDSAWFERSLAWIPATARAMRRLDARLPILPVFCGSRRAFAAEAHWAEGLDRFLKVAVGVGPSAIAVCFSPVGDGNERYEKLYRVFTAAAHAKRVTGTTVIAWRQGVYGPALVAAGLDGYETGIGTSEQADVRANVNRRKPRPDAEKRAGGGASANVYLEPLGRSVKTSVAAVLLGDIAFRAKVGCTDNRCCPRGAETTVGTRTRQPHAVRSRARQLTDLDSMPAAEWRLHHIANRAREAETLALQANRALASAGEKVRIPTSGYAALAAVADELRGTQPHAA